MEKASGFSPSRLSEIFHTVYEKGSVTIKEIAEGQSLSVVTAAKAVRHLEERGLLIKRPSKHNSPKGRRASLYSIDPKTAFVVYNLKEKELSVSLYTLKTKKRKTLLFNYDGKRRSDSPLEEFLKAQKALKRALKGQKTVVSSLYLVDGGYDKDTDRLFSANFPELASVPVSELDPWNTEYYVLGQAELVNDFLKNTSSEEKCLFVEYTSSQKNVYLFYKNSIFSSVALEELRRVICHDSVPFDDFSKRTDTICSVIKIFHCLYKPCDIRVLTPFVNRKTREEFRCLFDNESDCSVSSKDILLIDESSFPTDSVIINYLIERFALSLTTKAPKKKKAPSHTGRK